MRVLITGSQGKIGSVVASMAAEAGHEVRAMDLLASGPTGWEFLPVDLLDLQQVRRAVMGCEAIVHLAAIPNDRHRANDQVFNTNVTGTFNILQSAAEAGIGKVVFVSSVNSTGIWGSQRRPDYLPIDNKHPHYPNPAYGLSKHLGEEMCESYSRKFGLSTICLLPTLVWAEAHKPWWMRDADRARSHAIGDYYAYVMVRDVARACLLALDNGTIKHGRYILCGPDNAMGWDSREIIAKDYPEIPWVGPEDYFAENPRRSLIDTTAAWNDFGWKAEETWNFEEESASG